MPPRDEKPRAARRDIRTRVRLAVASAAEVDEHWAAAFADGAAFVRDDHPPPVGSLVALELVLPDGSRAASVVGEVLHARPAVTPGEAVAGMELRLVELDDDAEALAAKVRTSTTTAPAARAGERRLESIAAPERAPLIALDGPVVGMDLGTVNSCVAAVVGGRARVLASRPGYQIVPSVVFVPPAGDVLVGQRAVEKMILSPGRAIYGSKRFLGRPFASKEVRTLGHFFAYELTRGADGRAAARVEDRVVTLEEVAGHVLRALKQIAEEALSRTVQRAVITVPAYFGETQRQAVRDAARLAGLYVERILNEPTAAAVSYGWGREELGTILVYDLGGGTFDVAVLRVDGTRFEVLATDGDPFLGGSDFDDRLTEYVLMRFERAHGLRVRDDPVAVQRIRFAAELAKRQLSEATAAEMVLPYIARRDGAFVDLQTKLERETLEALTGDLVERTFTLMQRVLDTARLETRQLDDVLLVGGQTRSPHVRRMLAERFGRTPALVVHPDEAVALGAAIVGEAIRGKRSLELIDVLPASVRAARPDGSSFVLLPRGARLPATAELEIATGEGEYRVELYRGEEERAAQNTLIGIVRLPSSHALALAGTRATARVRVSAEGTLAVTVTNPLTGQAQQLEVAIASGP